MKNIKYIAKMIFLFVIFLQNLQGACSTSTTIAKEPLKFINDICLEENMNHDDFKNIYFNGKHLYIAKGSKGFDVVDIRHINYPIPNAIQMRLQDTKLIQADFIIADKNQYVYLANNQNLVIYKQKDLKYTSQVNIYKTININMITTSMYDDENYIYIGGPNRMQIYSKQTTSMIYDYNDIDGNITAITSKDNRLYIATNKKKIEVLVKNTLDGDLILTKIKYDGYLIAKSANNLFLNKQNIISFASKDGTSYRTLLANDMSAHKTYASGTKGNVNKFAFLDGFNIVSSDKGLYVEKADSLTNIYMDSFKSADMVIYDEFVIAVDKSENTNGNQELKLRAYKVNSVGASKVFGYVPFETNFRIDTINIKEVEWMFGDSNSYSIKTRYPSYTYNNAGVLNAIAKVTYNSGRVYTNRLVLIAEKKESFDFSATSDKYSGTIPFEVKFYTDIDKSINIRSIIWDFKNGNKSSSLYPTHTFNTVGDFNVSISIENTNGIKKVKYIGIKTKAVVSGSILTKQEGSILFTQKNIDFNLDTDTKIEFVKYIWEIDNRVFLSKNIKYKFTTAGVKTIKLLAYDINGVEHTFTKQIEIFDYQIPLITTSKLYGESPLVVSFAIKVPNEATYELNHIKWKFPNNKTSYDNIGNYEFKGEGQFKLKYEYRLSNGYFKESYIDINITNKSNLNVNTSKTFGQKPLTVAFDYSASSDTGIKGYELDFGDESKVIKTNNTSYIHTFREAKDYLVRITSISNKGHKTTKETLISAMDINATYNADSVNFNDLYSSSIMKTNFTVKPVNANHLSSFYWDFGDGDKSAANEQTITHIYNQSKTYLAKLHLVFDDKSTKEKILFITRPTPPGNLQLYKGWNLIGNTSKTPIRKSTSSIMSPLPNQNYLDLSLYSSAMSIWIFKNDIWHKNPEYIDPEYGMWIDMYKDDKLPFYGERNIPNLDNLKKGWHLLGTGVDIPDTSIYKFDKLMKYNSKTTKWIDMPKEIKSGEGFLVFIK